MFIVQASIISFRFLFCLNFCFLYSAIRFGCYKNGKSEFCHSNSMWLKMIMFFFYCNCLKQMKWTGTWDEQEWNEKKNTHTENRHTKPMMRNQARPFPFCVYTFSFYRWNLTDKIVKAIFTSFRSVFAFYCVSWKRDRCNGF